MLTTILNGMGRRRSRHPGGRASMLVPVTLVAAVALIVAAGCGGSSSKPAYCSDRSALESSVQGLSVPTSSDIGSLQTQLTTIQSDATALVNSGKSDFPSETSAIKSSVDKLTSAVNALPSSPSTSQIAAIAADVAAVTSSVKSFTDATSSKCS
jgi:hypothetical protein